MTWLYPYFIVATCLIPEVGIIKEVTIGPYESMNSVQRDFDTTWRHCNRSIIRAWRWIHVDYDGE